MNTTTGYETVIGLEVHAQLSTDSKIFTSSSAQAGHEPNSLTDAVTLGLPGCLPVLNRRVVEFAMKLGLATSCNIRQESIFARKHYHYPDLPKGYQISQYDKPICENGHLNVRVNNEVKKIGITRIHLEEDAGKSVHLENSPVSLVDLNRAGVPLVEIVSEPEMSSPEEAGAYMRQLRQIVKYLDICDGNLEEGSLRCDANISIRPKGQRELGVKVEIKNLNSFRHVEKALAHEIARQTAAAQQGETIVQETRLWDEARGITRTMRTKEYAEDYRYFPDPDLPPLMIGEDWIERTRENLPELPQEAFKRFKNVYNLEERTAEVLTEERVIAQYYDRAVAKHDNPSAIANWITTELFGKLNKEGLGMDECPVSPENLAELVQLIDNDTISGKIAKSVFDEMFIKGISPLSIVEAKGLRQITDPSQIQEVITRIIQANPDQIEQYRQGKTKVIGFLVGQIMKDTAGKANPRIVNQLLKEALDNSKV